MRRFIFYVGNDNRAGFRRTHEYTGVFNSAVMKQTSMWVSAGWVQISAFVVCLLMWLFTGRGAVSELWQIEPRYMLTGGVIGAFITYTVIKSFDALGPAKSALLIVVAQILVAT